jgi:hypothetical protein
VVGGWGDGVDGVGGCVDEGADEAAIVVIIGAGKCYEFGYIVNEERGHFTVSNR